MELTEYVGAASVIERVGLHKELLLKLGRAFTDAHHLRGILADSQ